MGHFKPDLLLKLFWFDPPFKIFLDFVALVPNFRDLTTNSLSQFSKRLRPQKLVAYYAAKNFAFLVLHIPVLS